MVDSRKRARVEESSNSGGGGDRISGLYNEILHHIFSFLPTREVVQTCVLSKRWRNLWCSVPWLDFDEEAFLASSSSSSSSSSSNRTDQAAAAAAAGSRFSTFVNYALLLRNGSSNIEKLRLSCSSNNTSSSNHVFQYYIVAALKHNLQVLDLKILQHHRHHHHHQAAENVLPSSLFTCESLTCLKLNNVVLPSSSSFRLSSLKTLLLISVKFQTNQRTLFENSRNLETLTLHNCIFEEKIRISVSQLKNLIIIEDEVPPSSTRSKPTFFYVPNLTSFKLFVQMQSGWYHVHCSKLLVEAEIHIKRPPLIKDISFGNILGFFYELNNVKAITLSGSCLEVIGEEMNILSKVVDTSFHNLKLMKLTTCFEECEVRGITYLLKQSPNIETLVIEYNSESSYKKNQLPMRKEKLPSECTLHHLKTIQMHGFGGRKNEVMLLTFLLENAKSLEKMIVK